MYQKFILPVLKVSISLHPKSKQRYKKKQQHTTEQIMKSIETLNTTTGIEYVIVCRDAEGEVYNVVNKHWRTRKGAERYAESMGWIIK